MRGRFPNIIIFIAAAFICASFPSRAVAYRLPSYTMSEEEKTLPAEKNLENYTHELERASAGRPQGVIENRRRNYKTRLSPSARRMVSNFDRARIAQTFWNYASDLKVHLISLLDDTTNEQARREADTMAKLIVQRIYDLSQEYEVTFSALINNALINSGHKNKGFCYHYVYDIKQALNGRRWEAFEIHWGEAWPQTFRENNALVVTAYGKPFHTGLAIDVWRTAGKPFWTPVEGDRFPWQEAFDVEKRYKLE